VAITYPAHERRLEFRLETGSIQHDVVVAERLILVELQFQSILCVNGLRVTSRALRAIPTRAYLSERPVRVDALVMPHAR
jgi:poly(A) polymerase Pap1